jgi:hypothetical protein
MYKSKNGSVNLNTLSNEFKNMFFVYCNTELKKMEFKKNGVLLDLESSPLFIYGQEYDWENS